MKTTITSNYNLQPCPKVEAVNDNTKVDYVVIAQLVFILVVGLATAFKLFF